MLLRFAAIITLFELALTAVASVLVTYTEPPAGFATTSDLRELGLSYEQHENHRGGQLNAPVYETKARLQSPSASLYVSLRTDSTPTDLDFRRSREEVIRDRTELGEGVIINEPSPGELGYAVRHRSSQSVKFELVRLRHSEMLIVRVEREVPFDTSPSAELARCERRARQVQEHLMFKLRWRD